MELAEKERSQVFDEKIPISVPSTALVRKAVQVVSFSYLQHSGQENIDSAREELECKMLDANIEEKMLIMAGLKRAGLGYSKLNGEINLSMRTPALSNPSPNEFSTELKIALDNPGDAHELLLEAGSKKLESPEGQREMSEWLENMEFAVRNKD